MAGSLAGMLAARTGLSPVMVGRADELARLRELVATTGALQRRPSDERLKTSADSWPGVTARLDASHTRWSAS